jgi:ribulose-5-phosphate 4-epimerase/fuculose-1-phosphate aldolase
MTASPVKLRSLREQVSEEEWQARIHVAAFNMILRNHGLIASGRSVAEAFVNIYELEFARRIQMDLMASGANIIRPSEQARGNNREIRKTFRAKHGFVAVTAREFLDGYRLD